MQLINRMDTNCDGKVSPDEFLELTCKLMEGLSETATQQGMKAMWSAAERLRLESEAVLTMEQELRNTLGVSMNECLRVSDLTHPTLPSDHSNFVRISQFIIPVLAVKAIRMDLRPHLRMAAR